MHLTIRRGRTRLLCRLGSQLRSAGPLGPVASALWRKLPRFFAASAAIWVTAPLAGRRLPDRIAAPLGQ
jgi:hypothetical protein